MSEYSINSQTFIANLTSFGVIQISGEDSNKFLQGQLTINAESINHEQLSLASICNIQGRCISLFFVFKVDEIIYLILKQETIPETLLTLKKYAVFFKVKLLDVSMEYQVLGIAKNLELNKDLKSTKKFKDELDSVYWFNSNIGLSIINKNKMLDSEQLNKEVLEENLWLFSLAKNRIPWLTLETQSHFLPHHLNLPQLLAVDFKKGCFTGQEVIARMQYKGKLKSHLQLFSCKSNLKSQAKGNILCDGKNAAEIICMTSVIGQGSLILALMKDIYLDHKIFQLTGENTPILKLLTN